MNSVKILIIAVFAAIACAFSGADANPKGLGEKALVALKKNDQATFSSYYITPAELKEQLKKSTNKQPFQQADDDELIDDYTDKYAKVGELSFSRIRKDGENKGVVWERAELDYIQYPLITVVKEVSKADVIINFKCDGKPYTLKLKDCMLTTKRGWCLFGEVRFEKVPKQ